MPTMRSAKRRASSTSCMLTTTGMLALGREPRQELHDLDRGLRVERRGRLVGEQQISGSCITARAMPTRWRCPPDSASARRVAKPERPTASSSSKARSMSASRESAQPRAPGRHVAEPPAQQVLHHRQALDQVVFLEHHADPAARPAQAAAGQLGEVLAAEQDLARGRLDQPVDAADQRGLAGARRADDRGEAACRAPRGRCPAAPACRADTPW